MFNIFALASIYDVESCAISNTNIDSTVDEVVFDINDLKVGVDIFFLIFAATVMFFMQAGFAMLCAGSVQAKNLQNTLMKNIIDACGK